MRITLELFGWEKGLEGVALIRAIKDHASGQSSEQAKRCVDALVDGQPVLLVFDNESARDAFRREAEALGVKYRQASAPPMGTAARIWLLAVAVYCGACFIVVEALDTAHVYGDKTDVLGITILLMMALIWQMPFMLPVFIPARWPRIHAWTRRVAAVYTLFLLLVAYGGLMAALYYPIPHEYSGLVTLARVASVVAMVLLIGSLAVLLQADVERIMKRMRGRG